MPINFARDTKKALGEFAAGCKNRSLLQQRFVFFEKDLDAARRLALDLWVDGGHEDVSALGAKAKEDADRKERNSGAGNDEVRKLRTLQALCDRMVKGFPTLALKPPDRRWLGKASFHLVTRQRLAIGLANGVWENTGLTLHRRFGYPLIPGSALKGLALRGAIDLQADESLQRVVLGEKPGAEKVTAGRAGTVGFLDAVAETAVVELDIVTPHYGNYYSGSANREAFDTESPKPNVFPVVAAGARFRFDLLLIRGRELGRFTGQQVLDAAQQWLTHALNILGAGAKSRSGYGRFGEGEPVGIAMSLFPDVSVVLSATSADPPPPAKTPAEACVARWLDKVPTFAFLMGPFVADLSALGDADLHNVARRLIKPEYWDTSGRPANPTTFFWKNFATAPGGAEVLARLMKTDG